MLLDSLLTFLDNFDWPDDVTGEITSDVIDVGGNDIGKGEPLKIQFGSGVSEPIDWETLSLHIYVEDSDDGLTDWATTTHKGPIYLNLAPAFIYVPKEHRRYLRLRITGIPGTEAVKLVGMSSHIVFDVQEWK